MKAASPKLQTSFSFSGLDQLQTYRHAVQLVTFIFLNAKLFGLASTGFIVPYLHPTQAPWSTVSGAWDSLEYTIARSFFPLVVVGVILLTGITVGRLYCGWACPFGMVQDLLSYLPFKKQKISQATLSQVKDIKWAVVGFSVLTSILVGFRRVSQPDQDPVGVFSDSPFSVWSPSGTLFAYIPWMMLWNINVLAKAGVIAWLKLFVLVAALSPSVFIPRFFCRFVCPLGAVLEPLSPYKFLRIQKSAQVTKDDANKILTDICPMGVQLETETDYISDHPGCVHCGKCVTEAPRKISQTLSCC
eukprot:TRINITY_DN89_c0_g1_i1.p1 TRINITY_DN89_c0_g1~~TRINITY_DN89_c0_g1_i1.p1  ORF type:complete len:302 (+),score=92.87 TRINITY_DN89_c0_g1_i1:153-1058(+)